MTKDHRDFLHRQRLWILLGLTLLGGVVRFSFLSKPPLWADEAYTYSRVCGSFRDMLEVLQWDGFPPLHYEAYWLLGRVCRLTPAQMRVIPAAAGTLMIPAIYFLAVQIVRRPRTALLAALFTCCSAYMLAYSRDAKMYPAAWLLVALHAGCLLWWLRTRLRIAWLGWVACGVGMTGLHLATVAVLPVDLLILITLLRGKSRAILAAAGGFVLGILIILGGLYGYEYRFNRWAQRNEEQGFAAASGLAWVDMVNRGRSGPDLALAASTAYLYGWEWPGGIVGLLGITPSPLVPRAGMIAGTVVLLLLAAGTVAWPRRRGARDEDEGSGTESGVDAAAGGLGQAGSGGELPKGGGGIAMAGAPAPPSMLNSRSSSSRSLQPWWRQALWLSFWIIVPAYGVYCASMRHFASPIEWLERVADLVGSSGVLVVAGAIVLAAALHFAPRAAPYAAALIPVAGLVLLVMSLHGVVRIGGKPMTFDAAYWPVATRWWDLATQRGVLVALLVLVPALAWNAAGPTLIVRARKTGQLLLVAGIIFASCLGVYGGFTHRFEHRVRRLVAADHRTVPSWNVLVFMSLRDHGVPTTQAAIQEVREASPNLSVPLVQERAAARVSAARRRWEELVGKAGRDTQAPRRAAERLAAEQVVWEEWVSVWQPRYLGMIWPAAAIAACALLVRLPTRPLRYASIGLLLAANLTQATARIAAQTEPPADRIATDVLASQETRDGQPTSTVTRTWLNGLMGFGVGDRMSNQDAQIRYYLAQVSGRSLSPKDVRDTPYPLSGSPWKPWHLTIRYDRPAREIARDLEASPWVRRAIVWDSGLYDGGLEKQLGPGWRLAGEEMFKYRLHWTWSEYRQYRRREFVRTAEGAQK